MEATAQLWASLLPPMTGLGDGPAPSETGPGLSEGTGWAGPWPLRKPCELSLLGSPSELGNLTS